MRAAPERRDLLAAAGLSLLVGAVYLPAVGLDFFSDDYFWLAAAKAALQRPSFFFMINFRDWNPLLHLSFACDLILGRGSPLPYHVTGILLHCLSVAILTLACRRFGARPAVALMAGLAWGLNPRISEAVIWPAARGHTLATLFVLAALLCALREASPIAVAGLLALGLLSKETAFFPMLVVPVVIVDRRRRRQTALLVAVLATAFTLFNLLVKPSLKIGNFGAVPPLLKTPFVLLRPLGLGDLYSFSVTGALVVALAVIVLVFLLRHSRVGLVGLAWVALSTFPVILLPNLTSRYLYMPAVGDSLVLCALIRLVDRHLTTARLRRVAASMGAALIALLVVANVVWIEREIADYRLLARPYRALVEEFRGPISEVEPGTSVVVYDLSPRDQPARLNQLIAARGTMSKLIPYRATGVGGLITLPNLINAIKPRTPGLLAAPSVGPGALPTLRLLYDGRNVEPIEVGAPASAVAPDRVFSATWGDAAAYFAARASGHVAG